MSEVELRLVKELWVPHKRLGLAVLLIYSECNAVRVEVSLARPAHRVEARLSPRERRMVTLVLQVGTEVRDLEAALLVRHEAQERVGLEGQAGGRDVVVHLLLLLDLHLLEMLQALLHELLALGHGALLLLAVDVQADAAELLPDEFVVGTTLVFEFLDANEDFVDLRVV